MMPSRLPGTFFENGLGYPRLNPKFLTAHNVPFRAHRQLLEQPANLGELLEQVAPNVVRGLALDRAQLLHRDLPLPDWRKRENDLFFRIPFREPALPEVNDVFVGVLVEHQSQADPGMALRTLLYATAFWDQQWKDWEKQAAPKGGSLQIRSWATRL